jgi:riboflavin synthase
MFTGIIEGLGSISAVRWIGQGKRLAMTADFALEGTKIGDSIAVSGACLTVVLLDGRRFEVDVSPETLQRSTLGSAKTGERVNLERALRVSDRIDGHLVSGHIDGLGRIVSRETRGNAIVVKIEVPPGLGRYMIEKGSVAVDGISLTINRCDEKRFEVSIIPHTAGLTTVGFKQVGDTVNIEADMIAKYVERLLGGRLRRPYEPSQESSGIDADFLFRTGFLQSR